MKSSSNPKTEDRETPSSENELSEVNLSAPWGTVNGCQNIARVSRIDAKEFVETRSKVHETYIIENEKTKRMCLWIACISFISSCLVLIFGPEGKEVMTYLLGASLMIISAGAVGYKRVWGKTEKFEFGASNFEEKTNSNKAAERNAE
ncbi:MAG: hypothetical protein AAGJ81_08180 [Verrucomicrobiota bacterium]